MVGFGFELVKHMLNDTFLIDKEANTVQAVIDLAHASLPLEIFSDSISDDL